MSEFTGLDYWNKLVDWNTGLNRMWFTTLAAQLQVAKLLLQCFELLLPVFESHTVFEGR